MQVFALGFVVKNDSTDTPSTQDVRDNRPTPLALPGLKSILESGSRVNGLVRRSGSTEIRSVTDRVSEETERKPSIKWVNEVRS